MFEGMKRRAIVPIVALSCLLTACTIDISDDRRPLHEEPVSVDLGSAVRADVQFHLGAGRLEIRGGSEKLLDGTLRYSSGAGRPQVRSSVNGSFASVTVEQRHNATFGNNRTEWDVRLNDKVLMDLRLHCGAGQAELSLGDLALQNVEVHMGAGQVDLDLRGHPTHDYDADIEGGVGQATVHLPEGVGIRVEAHGGIGSVTVTGLDKNGDHWQNSLYDNSKVNVRLRVHGGIGEIRIVG